MKRFRFRLEKVLDLRRMSEEKAQRRMAEAQRARALQEEARMTADSALANQISGLRAERSATFLVGDALTGVRYGQRLRRELADADVRLERAVHLVGDRRRELAEAMKQKKSLEILKEKRFAEHLGENQRIEQYAMDDEAGQRLARERAVNG